MTPPINALRPPLPPRPLAWALPGLIMSLWAGVVILARFGVPDWLIAHDGPLHISLSLWLSAVVITTCLAGMAIIERAGARSRAIADLMGQLLDDVPFPLQIKDADLRFVWFNKSFAREHTLLQTPASATLGKTTGEIVPDAILAEAVAAHDRRVITSGQIGEPQEQVIRRPDGSVGAVALVTKVPLRQNGRVIYLATTTATTSDWREAQRRNEEARKLLETVMDAAPITIQVIDRDMRFRWVNRAFREYFNAAEVPMIGQVLGEPGRAPHLVAEAVALNERIFATGEMPVEVEQYLPASDLRPEVHLLVTKVPIHDETGAVTQILTMGTDITALKQAQARIAVADNLIASILLHVPVTIQVKDTDLRIRWANQRFADATGRDITELLGKTLKELKLPTGSVAGSDEMDLDVLATGGTFQFVERWFLDGKFVYYLVIKVPLLDEQHRPTHVMTIGVDVSEEYRLRAETEEVRKQLQVVLDTVPVAIALKDREQRYKWLNREFERQFRTQAQTAIGRRTDEVIPDATWINDTLASDAEILSTGMEPQPIDLTVPRNDGATAIISVRKVPVKNAEGEVESILAVGVDVTELIRTTTELRALTADLEQRVKQRTHDLANASQLVTAVLQSAPTAIIVCNLDGTFRMWNAAAAATTGFPDLAAFQEFISGSHRAGRQIRDDMLAQAALGKAVTNKELRFTRPDGTTVDLLASSAPLFNAEGVIDGMVSSWLDITEKRQAEAEMRTWYAAFQQAGVGLALTRGTTPDDLRIIGANSVMHRLMGMPTGAEIRRVPSEIYSEADRERVAAAATLVLSGGRAAYEATLSRWDGTTFAAAVTIDNVVLPGETVPVQVVTVSDISDRKRVEAERDRWAEAIEHAAFGISIVDAKTNRYLAANRAYQKMHGRSDIGMVGLSVSEFFPEEQIPLLNGHRQEAETFGGAARDQIRLRADGSHFPARCWLSAVRADGGEPAYLICSAIDITEELRTEAQLRQAQKMEAIGQLTGGLAHDFNNLLAVIIGNLDFLKDTPGLDADTVEMADNALEAALKGADLTRNLLAFARRQPLAPKLTDIGQVLQRTSRLLLRTLGENIRLAVPARPDTWPAMVDPAQLESSLLNLAVNARDAMPDGGTLTITATNETVSAEAAHGGFGVPQGDYTVIRVSDTGTGMTPDTAAKAFDPFFTTKGNGGSGLGLSMVHGFVKQSGGHVVLRSEVGHGTVVELYLPRATGCVVDEEPETATDLPLGSEVVLAVEDDASVRKVLIRRLRQLGYRTLEAENATEALEFLRGDIAVDLLFTDIVMPGGMDGKQLAVAAKKVRPDIKVLFTSGFPSAAGSAGCFGDLGGDLLMKPYSMMTLADRLSRTIRGA